MTRINKLRAIQFEAYMLFKYTIVEAFILAMGALFFLGVFACLPQ